ncbi:potassium channel family protein [Saccharopolyspora halophila]|uniref:Potassium channel family protein n=1 Tax=Saccharopolyspora halophila TaxID=405551 RepID=A0ABN3GGD4_9PSEU
MTAEAAEARAEPGLYRWERRTEWPMVTLSVLFLALYAWNVLQPDMPDSLNRAISTGMWVTWVAFAIDYVVKFALARERGRFFVRHLFDLAVLVLPLLRQLRVLRVVMVLLMLNRKSQGQVRGRVVLYVSGAVALLGFSAALAVLEVERRAPDSTIKTFGDAVWWTMTTITTVGYGDYSPVTDRGKFIAAGLMIAGIAMLGVVTGSIASWFVDRFGGIERQLEQTSSDSRRLDDDSEALRAEIGVLREEIASLRQELTASKAETRGHD